MEEVFLSLHSFLSQIIYGLTMQYIKGWLSTPNPPLPVNGGPPTSERISPCVPIYVLWITQKRNANCKIKWCLFPPNSTTFNKLWTTFVHWFFADIETFGRKWISFKNHMNQCQHLVHITPLTQAMTCVASSHLGRKVSTYLSGFHFVMVIILKNPLVAKS